MSRQVLALPVVLAKSKLGELILHCLAEECLIAVWHLSPCLGNSHSGGLPLYLQSCEQLPRIATNCFDSLRTHRCSIFLLNVFTRARTLFPRNPGLVLHPGFVRRPVPLRPETDVWEVILREVYHSWLYSPGRQ